MADQTKKGLSLYAHLIGGDSSTISSAPVKYDVKKAEEDAAAAQKKKDASLKFQPIKRPQVKANKPKTSSQAASSSAHKFSSSTTTASVNPLGPSSTPSVQKSNFEDWVGDDDDGYYYQERQNNARKNNRKKNKKKNQHQQRPAQILDWDDIYDPTRPNSYADYKGSDEQYREHRDWKARLYYWQLQDVEKEKQKNEGQNRKPMNSMFAPPASLNFAPPSFDDPPAPQPMDTDDDPYSPPRPSSSGRTTGNGFSAPLSFAPPTTSDDAATDEDPYERRMRLSGMAPAYSPPKQPSPPPVHAPPPAVKEVDPVQAANQAAKLAEAQAKIAALKAKMAKPATPMQNTTTEVPPPPPPPPVEELGSGTISRAPVRYDPPPVSKDSDTDMADSDANTATAEDQPRSKAPGQKGFAERMLKKYGWEKGQGLGAQGDGITTALMGKAEKPQKRTNADGERTKLPTIGKIVGGKRRKVEGQADDDTAHFGAMSSVVKLSGMLTGLDVQKEIEDNNLMQEIGEEMGEKYGSVERVFVWREEMGGNGEVFVKFVSQLSALRAVNAMDEMTFAGNKVAARYFAEEAFEKGEYGG